MDDRMLKARLTADAPAAQDALFTLGVMRAIEQRRFRRDVILAGGLALLAAALLFALAPMLDAVLHQAVLPLGNGALLVVLVAVTLALPQLSRSEL